MVRRLSPLPSPFLRFKKATFLQRKSCSGYENRGCWKAGALSTRLASAGSLPRCPQGPCPPCVAIVQAQLRAPARPAAACRRRERRRARSAPAEPWARRAFLRLSPGWSPRCVCRASSVSVTRGPGALTHLADSILFPHPPPSPRPSHPCQPVPLRSTQLAHWPPPACPVSINTRSLSQELGEAHRGASDLAGGIPSTLLDPLWL